jgi:nucleoid-associated protein YgaU
MFSVQIFLSVADATTIHEGKRVMTTRYVVRSGDTLSGIARRFGVSLSHLEAANPQIINPDLIFPRQVIYIPSPEPIQEPEPMPEPGPMPEPEPAGNAGGEG